MAQSNRSNMILKIQELGFACVDLNLYLDNHPDDANAVNMYNSFSKQLNEAIRNYECKYGPLTNFGYGKNKTTYRWYYGSWNGYPYEGYLYVKEDSVLADSSHKVTDSGYLYYQAFQVKNH